MSGCWRRQAAADVHTEQERKRVLVGHLAGQAVRLTDFSFNFFFGCCPHLFASLGHLRHRHHLF